MTPTAKGHRDALESIHIQNGLREADEERDGETGTFRGFLTIFCTATDGFRMMGQLDPTEVRKLGLNFLAAAEAAVQDAVVMNILIKEGAPPEVGASVVTAMRDERVRINPDPEGDDTTPL